MILHAIDIDQRSFGYTTNNVNTTRQHVYEDLPPYVCTYAECITANQRYCRRRDWQRHLAKAHNRYWQCPLGCSQRFDSEAKFQKHLVKEHGQAGDRATQQRMSDACVVAPNDISDLTCPLCQKSLSSSKPWMKHLGHHLVQLALHSVPQHLFTSEGESDASDLSARSSESSEIKAYLDPSSDMDAGLFRTRDQEDEKAIDVPSKPIRFNDALGRKFSFPFELCNTWTGIESLINQAFENNDILGERVRRGEYNLVGPNHKIFLSREWEKTIRPGQDIYMHMSSTSESSPGPDAEIDPTKEGDERFRKFHRLPKEPYIKDAIEKMGYMYGESLQSYHVDASLNTVSISRPELYLTSH